MKFCKSRRHKTNAGIRKNWLLKMLPCRSMVTNTHNSGKMQEKLHIFSQFYSKFGSTQWSLNRSSPKYHHKIVVKKRHLIKGCSSGQGKDICKHFFFNWATCILMDKFLSNIRHCVASWWWCASPISSKLLQISKSSFWKTTIMLTTCCVDQTSGLKLLTFYSS